MAESGVLRIPTGSSSVTVRVIDTTAHIKRIPSGFFFGPSLKGFETFDAVAYAFLITHTDSTSGEERRMLFDLGPPKDWQNDLPEPLVQAIKGWNAEITIDKHVHEILEDSGIDPAVVEAIVWSHPHWDHIGRPSLWPSSVKLITGPGVKEAFMPGYPEDQSGTVLSREFTSREIHELDFTTSPLNIGPLKAIDFFGDGSFYFLSAPGHCIGHLNALARTTPTTATSPSTFILMGADSFHHGSQLRPSEHVPLPPSVELPSFTPYPCPGSLFHKFTHQAPLTNLLFPLTTMPTSKPTTLTLNHLRSSPFPSQRRDSLLLQT